MIKKILSWLGLNSSDSPNIQFGRYSDAFKSERQMEAWQTSIKEYGKKNYLASYRHFFDYLLDQKQENVVVTEQNNRIDFKIYQGSKVVKGFATPEKVVAEAHIVKYEKSNVAFMRRLLEQNYSLKYSYFALSDNTAFLKFHSSTIDSAPDKLYEAFKEIATNADKQDDLLLAEFPDLISINDEHIQEIKIEQKEVKYAYIHKWITETLAQIKELDRQKHESTITYLLLNLAYKIDYLVIPQGRLTYELEQMSKNVYNDYTLTKATRNNMLMQKFKGFLKWNKEDIFKELYNVKSTFGVGVTTRQKIVSTLIQEEIKSMLNTHTSTSALDKIRLEHIPLSALFHYNMRSHTHALFALIIEIIYADYVQDLGFESELYDLKINKLNSPNIQKRLRSIHSKAGQSHSNFNLSVKSIKFDSLNGFIKSLLLEMKDLDYN